MAIFGNYASSMCIEGEGKGEQTDFNARNHSK
jgi:hypothetical protein